MAGTKKKKNHMLVFLLGIIVVLGALYLLVDRRQTEKEEEGKAQEVDLELYETRMTRISRIRVENEYYDMVLAKDEEGNWHREGQEDFEVNSRHMTSILSAAMKIRATNRVAETVEDPAEYGLADPIARVTVESEDGDVSFVVGGRAPMLDTFYFMIEGNPGLYTVSSQYYYTFHRTETQMQAVEQIDVPGASAIRRVQVERADGVVLDFLYDPETDTGSFVKPYPTPQAADSDSAQSFKKLFTDFSLEECQGEEQELDLAEYGLEKPAAKIQVIWQESGEEAEEGIDLKVGSRTEDSEYYYVQAEASGRVYTMEADILEPMAEAEPFPYIQKALIRAEDGEIKKITAEKDGKRIEIEEGELPAWREALAEVELEGDLLGAGSEKEGGLVLRLILAGEKEERELSFYAYDGNHFYLLRDDDGNSFLVGKRETDAAAALLSE